jgi:cytochrome c-type biogenesis protein
MLNSIPQNLPLPLRSVSRERLLVPALVLLAGLLLLIGALTQSGAPGHAAVGLASQSFLVLAFLSFVGGIISFVSPCTLPILPAYFAFATQSGRKRIAANTIAFLLGVATMFSLLGASASALGRLLLQNQQLLLLLGGAIVMVFGVMSLLGRGFSGVSQSNGAAPATTARGSYAFGLTFSVGWSSCVGPILGVVLTLAASTGSVTRGMVLLFVYALGLGLPLIIVSTFFGRASRKSLFWRLLKGRGWDWETHTLVVGLIWALAIWRVLAAFGQYLFRNLDFFAGQQFTAGHETGLLGLVIAGAALWIFTDPGERKTTLALHSTQLFSGVLFILMAVLMLNGTLSTFNALIPADLAVWFAGLEERLITLFS